MRWQRAGAAGWLSLAVAACGPPPTMVPALPPGIDSASIEKPNPDDVAQAQGEQWAQSKLIKTATPKVQEPDTPPPLGQFAEKTTPSGLKIRFVRPGTGAVVAAKGDRVAVHYTGWEVGGKKFDSSRERGGPHEFTLGSIPPKVIQGWEEGLLGMKVGERRRLTIPPDLAYGAQGRPGISPNATLIFDVELMSAEGPDHPTAAAPGPSPARAPAAGEMPEPFSAPGGL